MAMNPSNQIAGSVTGGCIEAAVYEEAQEVIATKNPTLLHYSSTNEETPFDIGLSCGGMLDVLIESLDSEGWQKIFPALEACLKQNEFVSMITIISSANLGEKMLVWFDGRRLGSLGNINLDYEAAALAQVQMHKNQPGWFKLGKVEVFIDVLPPAARLIVIGAVHISIPLVSMAKTLGFRTIVVDSRKTFANLERFPHADELIIEWPVDALKKLLPDENTYIVALSHDEKIDNPALAVALSGPARYVGVLGAKKNVPKRVKALRELNITEKQINRLHAPVGLDLGASSMEEIALSILAEIVAEKHSAEK